MAVAVFPLVDPWVAGRADRRDAAVYRRRRAVALLMLAVAIAMATAVSRFALAGSGGGALTTAGSSGVQAGGSARPGHLYVVQPGDTLWSIVQATGRGGDPRPEVDRLALQRNGRPLQPGERLLLP